MEGEKTPHFNAGTDVSRHTLMMILGCLIPLALLGVLWFAGVSENILVFWDSTALPDNAPCDDEEHETWRDAGRR